MTINKNSFRKIVVNDELFVWTVSSQELELIPDEAIR